MARYKDIVVSKSVTDAQLRNHLKHHKLFAYAVEVIDTPNKNIPEKNWTMRVWLEAPYDLGAHQKVED